MNHFELVTLKSGVKSLRSLEHQETFHPTSGPWGEATILHTGQQRLVERCTGPEKFVIWDIGFGAAANVLAAIDALKNSEHEIEIHSFDKSTTAIDFTLNHAQELNYPLDYESSLRKLLMERAVQIYPHIHWRFHLGDFSEQIKSGYPHLLSPHSIFFDPYSAATNPEMWTLDVFSALWKKLDPNSECLLTNYTRSTAVRVSLLLAGFYVGVGCEIGEKAETTIASNQLHLLKKPLDRAWLKRIKASLNSAPLRTSVYSKSKMSDEDFERLQKHPQFKE